MKEKFLYRIGEYLWTQHVIYGWVRGRVQQKYLDKGQKYYRVVIWDGKTVNMMITAKETDFQKEQP